MAPFLYSLCRCCSSAFAAEDEPASSSASASLRDKALVEEEDVFFDCLENAFEVETALWEDKRNNNSVAGFLDECEDDEDGGDQQEESARRKKLLAVTSLLEETVTRNEGYCRVHESHPKISYRHVRGTATHSVKYEAEHDFSADKVFAMGWEFNFLDTWNPFAIEPTILQAEGDRTMTLYCAVWLPWPFHPRELYVFIEVSDVLDEHKCYVVTIRDIEYENKLPESLHRVDSNKRRKRERCSILNGSCAVVYPLGSDLKEAGKGKKGRTRVLISCHADPLILAPPNWLVNFILKLMAPTIYRSLEKALRRVYSADSPAPYAEIVKEKEMYSKMRHRISTMVDA